MHEKDEIKEEEKQPENLKQESNNLTKHNYEFILDNHNVMKVITDKDHNVSLTIFNENNIAIKDSINIICLIGQENFNIVILALKSVVNLNLRVKALASLLTEKKDKILIDELAQTVNSKAHFKTSLLQENLQLPMTKLINLKNIPTNPTEKKSTQLLQNIVIKKTNNLPQTNPIKILNLKSILDENNKLKKELSIKKIEKVENSTQTDMMTKESLFKVPKKRKRANVTTCVVKNADPEPFKNLFYKEEKPVVNIKKTIIDPEEYKKTMFNNHVDGNLDMSDESSCMSVGSNFSIKSFGTDVIGEHANFFLNMTQQCTQDDINLENETSYTETLEDLKEKPTDAFHIARPHILGSLTSHTDKLKLLYKQAYLDWSHCLMPNEYDRLPIHEAAINDDLELLKRQCVILKARGESVDIGDGCKNISALQYAINYRSSPIIISTLLSYGADVLELDDDNWTAFHYAAECGQYHTLLITHCTDNICSILSEHKLWEHKRETKKEILLQSLFNKICTMFDNEGYNPLMIASKSGHYSYVEAMLKISTDHINIAMPNSGNTALYLAVENSVYKDPKNQQNIGKNYLDTITCLIDHGADPGLANLSGFTVLGLIQDLKYIQLSKIILNYNELNNTTQKLFENDMYITNTKTIIHSTDKTLKNKVVKKMPKKNEIKILKNVVVIHGKSVLKLGKPVNS